MYGSVCICDSICDYICHIVTVHVCVCVCVCVCVNERERERERVFRLDFTKNFILTTSILAQYVYVRQRDRSAQVDIVSFGKAHICSAPSLSSRLPPWPCGKASASRAEDPGFKSRLRRV